MKKLVSAIAIAVIALGARAQDNLLQFLPNEKGTQIVSKSYDANDNLQGTMTMTVTENYEYFDGQDLEFAYVMTDADGNTVNSGTIGARYMDSNFYFDMKSKALSPTIGQYISMTTDLSGDFLDYPNTFGDWNIIDQPFQMDGGDFTITSAGDKKPVASIRVYNREIEKDSEKITTPAGTFDATRIGFTVDVLQDGVEHTYLGKEWYSAGSGIVRSEIYDRQHNLQDYTVLTSITK